MGETIIKENIFLGLQCTKYNKHLGISSRKNSGQLCMQNWSYSRNSHLLGTCFGPGYGLRVWQIIPNFILKTIQWIGCFYYYYTDKGNGGLERLSNMSSLRVNKYRN